MKLINLENLERPSKRKHRKVPPILFCFADADIGNSNSRHNSIRTDKELISCSIQKHRNGFEEYFEILYIDQSIIIGIFEYQIQASFLSPHLYSPKQGVFKFYPEEKENCADMVAREGKRY